MVGRRNPNPRGRATDPSKLGELRPAVLQSISAAAAAASASAKSTDDQDMRDPTVELAADSVVQPEHADAPQKALTPHPLLTDDQDMRDPTVESDLELDADSVVQPDHADAPQKMGECSVEVTEESHDASQEAISQAMEAMSEGKLEEAFEHLIKAILLSPTSAIMYGTRAAPGLKPSERVGTGFRGVRWLTSGRYQSHFKDKKDVTVGTFDTLEEAVKARVMAMLKVKRPKAKKLKGSNAKKKLERSKQENKLKDDSLRKLEDKCQHLQDKVNEIEVMAEKQQHQLSRKLKEKEELCTALEQKIKELELEVLLGRLSLLEVKLQEIKFPLAREEAGSEHGHGCSPIDEGRGQPGRRTYS